MEFDPEYWQEKLQYPDWYIRLEKELTQIFFPVVHNSTLKEYRHQVYDLVVSLLTDGKIPLASSGPDFDSERQQIDTIVIHHTESDPQTSPFKISAIGLLRLYAQKYVANNVVGRSLRGLPIWSGHFYKEQQVFFGYHWYVYPDGRREQLLPDGKIGWQSGNWEVNTRSVAIALSGNYEQDTPPSSQIASVAEIIKKKYPNVEKSKIVGHREVREHRTCPGEQFISGWKNDLLTLV